MIYLWAKMIKIPFAFSSYKEEQYWSSVCITSSQVFLAIVAASIFTGDLDLNRVFVILSNLILTIVCFYLGWRIIK